MSPSRNVRIGGALVVVFIAATPGTAAAGGSRAARIGIAEQALARVADPAVAHAAELRAAARRGGIARLLKASWGGPLLAAGGTPSASGQQPSDGRLVPPVEALREAVEIARLAVERATHGITPTDVSRFMRAGAARFPVPADRRAVRASSTPHLRPPTAPRVDMEVMRAAALQLAGKIDAALPALRMIAATPQRPDVEAACDLVNALPALCVGGVGSNTYTADAAVLVDLGGDDIYRNSAGAGGVFLSSPVSVNIDLGGNDVYAPPEVPSGVVRAFHGTGYIGIGMLVDAGGDDAYRVTAAPPATRFGTQIAAQGTAVLGVGVLADLAGNDEYQVDLPPDVLANLQGSASGDRSTGVLMDSGAGDDTYAFTGGTARAPAGATSGQAVHASGQGFGQTVGSTGALVDAGGSDTVSASAATEIGSEHTRYTDFVINPRASLIVQGNGLEAGKGLLVMGSGPTSYSARVTGVGLGIHLVLAQGVGWTQGVDPGTGVLDDEGGDDSYVASSQATAASSVLAEPGCGCPIVAATMDAAGLGNAQEVVAQGASGLFIVGSGGIGVLADHGGDDRYLATLAGQVTARAEAGENGVPASATAKAFATGPLYVQGSSNNSGVGVLADDDGDDVYSARVRQSGTAVATPAPGQTASATARAGSFLGLGPTVLAQGATRMSSGAGILRDAGGSDRYEATARTEADAFPTRAGAEENRDNGAYQGSGPNAILQDRDTGSADAFVAEPNFYPVCEGRRGESPGWTECAAARNGGTTYGGLRLPLGRGFVNDALQKSDPSVTFAPSQALEGAGGSALSVSGTLAGAAGAALTDGFVDVRLQQEITTPASGLGTAQGPGAAWTDLAATHAYAGGDGRWAAVFQLPTLTAAELARGPIRLWAGYSGTETLRPTTTGAPFALR